MARTTAPARAMAPGMTRSDPMINVARRSSPSYPLARPGAVDHPYLLTLRATTSAAAPWGGEAGSGALGGGRPKDPGSLGGSRLLGPSVDLLHRREQRGQEAPLELAHLRL